MVEVSISRARRAWEAWCRTDSEPQRDLAGAKTYGRRSEEEGVYTQSLPLDPLPAQPFFVCFADCESKCAWASWQPGELIGTPISLAEAGIVDERALAAAIKRQYNFAAHEGMRAEEGPVQWCSVLLSKVGIVSHFSLADCAASGCTPRVLELLEEGADINELPTEEWHEPGATPLLCASYNGCAAMHWYVAWDLPDRERVQENARREIRQLIDDFENREEI